MGIARFPSASLGFVLFHTGRSQCRIVAIVQSHTENLKEIMLRVVVLIFVVLSRGRSLSLFSLTGVISCDRLNRSIGCRSPAMWNLSKKQQKLIEFSYGQ